MTLPRRRGMMAVASVLLLAILAGGAAGAVGLTAALLTGSAVLGASITADDLQPPTGLGATGGASVALMWAPSVDMYATGYRVLRSTASGGPYAEVQTVTPASSSSTTDTPPVDGTYWYELTTYQGGWDSAATAQVSAAITMGVTGFRACTAQAADTGGDGNGYQTNAANGCVANGAVATDLNSGSGTSTLCTSTAKDRHRFSAFALGVPGTAPAVGGISVRVRLGLDLLSGTNLVCAQLSWDGGASWTTTLSTALTASALTSYTLGGPTNTWGRTWTGSQLSEANFRVRLINVSNNNARDFTLDSVEVDVRYTP